MITVTIPTWVVIVVVIYISATLILKVLGHFLDDKLKKEKDILLKLQQRRITQEANVRDRYKEDAWITYRDKRLETMSNAHLWNQREAQRVFDAALDMGHVKGYANGYNTGFADAQDNDHHYYD